MLRLLKEVTHMTDSRVDHYLAGLDAPLPPHIASSDGKWSGDMSDRRDRL